MAELTLWWVLYNNKISDTKMIEMVDTEMLKDLLGDTLQGMLEAEMDQVNACVLVQSYKDKITKLGVYDIPSEARFNLEIALDKFLDDQYGEDLLQACYK